jgi:hypothetical protein
MRTDGDGLGIRVAQGPLVFVTSEDDRNDVNSACAPSLKAIQK